jgi:anti-sigma factor (TIGR02949 family)
MTTFAIPCIEVIHQLWDYLDGELTPDRAQGIAEHLEACAGCNAVSDFEIAFRDTARKLLGEAPPVPALRDRVVAALRAKGFRNQR